MNKAQIMLFKLLEAKGKKSLAAVVRVGPRGPHHAKCRDFPFLWLYSHLHTLTLTLTFPFK